MTLFTHAGGTDLQNFTAYVYNCRLQSDHADEDGSYLLQFMTDVAGTYRLSLAVGGLAVPLGRPDEPLNLVVVRFPGYENAICKVGI